jgi:Cu2+-containing amine oxidase
MQLNEMPHPLDNLSVDETNAARDVVLATHPDGVIFFREIFLQEPAKEELTRFLALEHAGSLSSTTPRPARLAKCQYDVVGRDKVPEFHESIVDVVKKHSVHHVVVGKHQHASLTLYDQTIPYHLIIPYVELTPFQRRIRHPRGSLQNLTQIPASHRRFHTA